MRRVKASHPFFAAPLLSLAISVLVLFIRLVDMDSESRAAVYGVMIILQLAVFCVPSVVFCGFRGRGYIGRLGLALPHRKTFPVIAFGTLFLILASCVLKFGIFHFAYDSSAYSLYGSSISVNTESFGEWLLMLLSLAILPAITEEFVFRGIIMHEYRMCGALLPMLISALFFAFIHFDLKQFPIYFVMGMILGWLAFLTKSLWAPVAAHLIYNLFAVFTEKYIWLFSSNPDSDILFWLILIVFLLVCAFFFLSFAEKLLRVYAEKGETAPKPVPKGKVTLMLWDVFTSVPFIGQTLLFLIFGIIMLF